MAAGGDLIGRLRVSLGLDSTEFQEGLKGSNSALTRWAAQAETVGRSIRNIGAGMSLTVTAPLLLAGRNAIAAASDVQEAQSMFDEVFKDSAASTRAWADDLAARIGRSTFDLQAQAAQFQQVLTAFYPTRAEAAEMSQVMAGLAQDVASFYNISESEAVTKLRSGLTGEMEPLKSLGVVISEAAVQAEGLALGLAETTKELTAQDKAAARASLIVKGLADATGDAERTSSSYSNRLRALQASFGDLRAEMGQMLLPTATMMVGKVREVIEAFRSLSPETQKIIASFAGVAAALGPLLSGLGLFLMTLKPLVGLVAGIATPFGAAAAAVIALGAAAAYAYTHWAELSEEFPRATAAVEALPEQFETSINRIKASFDALNDRDWSALGANVRAMAEDVVSGLDVLIDGAFGDGKADSARQWVDNVAAELGRMPTEAAGKIGALAAALAAGLASIASQAVGWAQSIVTSIGTGLAGMYQAAVSAVSELARGFRESVTGLIDEAKGWGANIASGLTSGLANARSTIRGAVKGMADTVKGTFTGETEIQSPSRVFMRFGQFIADGLAIGIDQGKGGPISAMQDLASGIGNVFKGILLEGKSFGDSMKEMLSSLFSGWASSIFDSGWQGLLGGFGLPSFAGGGFTGNIPRSGGLDGRGGFLAMMHGNETVIDHTRGQGVHVTVGVDPRSGNLTAFVDQRAGMASARMGTQIERGSPSRIAQYERDPLRR